MGPQRRAGKTTDKGADAYAAASQQEAPWANALAEGMSPEELETVRRVLNTLTARLDAD